MKVRLLQDVEEGANIKVSPRKLPSFRNQKQADGKVVKAPEKLGRDPILWMKGQVIEMSDASAQKYIKAGIAEAVK